MKLVWAILAAVLFILTGYIVGGVFGLQLAVCIVGPVAFIAISIWENAKKGKGPLVFVKRNWIMVVEDGDNPVRLLANLPDGWRTKKMKIFQFSDTNRTSGLLESLGLYWKGFAPSKIKEFPFIHERVNPKLKEDTVSGEWIERDPEPVPTKHLLFDMPHWFLVPGVEFACGFRADILVETQTRVIDPLVAIYNRNGKFFEIMNSLVNSAVINKCRLMTYKQFVAEDTDATSDFSKEEMIPSIGPTLLELAGLEIYKFFVYRYDASNKEQERLMQEEAAAQIRLAVAKLDAQGGVADLTESARALKAELGPSADPNLIAQIVGDVAVAERIRKSNLQAVGAGGLVGLTGKKSPGKGGKK